MPISAIYDPLRRIVEQEFSDIIVYAAVETLPTGDARKLRLHVSTFPKHFHDGSELNVVASHLSSDPLQAIREFCTFVRQVLQATG